MSTFSRPISKLLRTEAVPFVPFQTLGCLPSQPQVQARSEWLSSQAPRLRPASKSTALLTSQQRSPSHIITSSSTTPRIRPLHTTPAAHRVRLPQRLTATTNRPDERPPSEPPTTDFGRMDMLGDIPVPSTSIDVCHADGFVLNSGVQVRGGSGVLLVGGEAFTWRPWEAKGSKKLVNEKGQWEVPSEVWGVLGVIWPKPDLLIVGVGPEIRPLSPATRQAISALGIRVDVLDTRNAASQYNMLATERGVNDVAAALIPIGWKDGIGVVFSSSSSAAAGGKKECNKG